MSLADVLLGYATPAEPTLKNRIVGLITLQRVGVVVMGLPLALGSAVLAYLEMYGNAPSFNDPRLPIGIAAVWLLVAAVHTINDVVDLERDKRKFPKRPLPSGLISRRVATLYGILMAGIGVMLASLFNWLCAAISLIVVVMGYVYTRYTRDMIGYLTMVWIPALEPVGAWAAIAPETILTPLPWLLFLFMTIHQVAMIIADDFETLAPGAKAFFIKLNADIERKIYVASVVALLFIGACIFFYAKLHWTYMVVLAVITALALNSAKYLDESLSIEKVKKAFATITHYNTIHWLAIIVTACI